MFKWALLIPLFFSFVLVQAQRDSLPQAGTSEVLIQQVIEDFVADGNTSFEFDAVYDLLESYQKRPLDLNKATEDDLAQLPFFSAVQISKILEHRREFGDFISLYELQVIPGFSTIFIKAIAPYVRAGGSLDDFKLPLGRMLIEGDNTLFGRLSHRFPIGNAYESQDGEVPKFEGNPFRYYLRFRHGYYNRLSYGFTAEKDAGEAFFKGSNKKGFDYYSAHFYIKDYKRWLKGLALGDYQVSLGQGLILYSGFGSRKGAQVNNIKRNAAGIRAYRSVDENLFLRGGAVDLRIGEHFSLMAFGSIRNRDGNGALADSIDQEVLAVTSLLTSGLHRTENEIEDENAITQSSIGGRIGFSKNRLTVAVNGLYNRISNPLQLNLKSYNQFNFQGTELLNASFDYSWSARNVNIFGEWAYSDNGSFAYTNGILANINRFSDVSLLQRNFSRDYQALNATPFAESSGSRNERGLYLGFEVKPNIRWAFSGYYDLYSFKWLKFGRDAPTTGRDLRLRLTHRKKRKYETYIELRDEIQSENLPGNETVFNQLVPGKRLQLRWNLSYNLSKSLVWRTRADWGFFQVDGMDKEKGYAIYQDFLWKPAAIPFSFTSRLSVFDTDGFNIRFYSYENNLLNSFSIPAYYSKGFRYYLNVRYRGISNVTLEARYAVTTIPSAIGFISNGSFVAGNSRNEFSAQVKVKF